MNIDVTDKKRFLKWCGARVYGNMFTFDNGGGSFSIPFWQPDLDFIFRHAVPKLEECHLITFRQDEYYSIAKLNGKVEDATDKDPAQALFKALLKVIDNG